MFKSKERKEIERKIRMRKAKNLVQNYIIKLERLQKRIFNQGKEYAKLGDGRMVKSQASKYLALENRIRQAKKLLLLMEEAEIQRELVGVSASFIQFSKDIVNSIADAPKIKDISKMHVKFEEAMAKVEGMEEVLNTVIDAASEGILSGEEFSEEKIEEVAKLLEGEAGTEESEIDKKIEKKLKDIEEMMKK
ncbi:MAG TPA: hypothetical protein ENI52_01640 [Thermoplasmata archaeon]|nr:hypothetical protein [Thermoplasmata archaeon]